LRVLHVVRANALERPGGDLAQAQGAGRGLRELGVTVDLVPTETPDPAGYDVAHVFGVFEPQTAQRQIAAIRARGVPLVLSPIFGDLRLYFATSPLLVRALEARSPRAVERRLAAMRRLERKRAWSGKIARQTDRRLAQQRELLLQADVLLPSSEVEAYHYGERLRVTSVPVVIARVGADEPGAASHPPRARAGVVCFGRVETLKNQAALLYALRDVDVEVTIVGREYDRPYSRLCRRLATPRTTFVSSVPRETVFGMMARAAVHALPSWQELPGLASIEAAATGARVVVGTRGSEREYFGPDVDYADPAEPASVRTAVLRALEREPRTPGDALDERLRTLTWRRHAEATLGAYERAVAR
jgi:glycosyltransferase involved in cell wall biosynthesis